MTLKEKLDEKIQQDSVQSLWDEIQTIFLSLDYYVLSRGVTMRVFQNGNSSPLYYVIGDKSSGTAFLGKYDLHTFENVIPICEENGLYVNQINNDCFALRYTP